jgi:hypothetical protein
MERLGPDSRLEGTQPLATFVAKLTFRKLEDGRDLKQSVHSEFRGKAARDDYWFAATLNNISFA